jgi:heat shock protein HtpX
MRRQRDLFPPDRGLQVRMVATVVGFMVVVAGTLVGGAWVLMLLSGGDDLFLAIGCVIVVMLVGAAAVGGSSEEAGLPADHADVVRADKALQRLAMVADTPAPRLRVAVRDEPLSWAAWVPRRRPEIWLTTGLMKRIGDGELEAVVAHECAHVEGRDAMLMTLLAGPPTALIAGLRAMKGRGTLAPRLFGLAFLPSALCATALVRLVSRHREFAADHRAAALTGSPAAVASALIEVSGDLRGRNTDLRAAAARDVFYFVPLTKPEGRLAGLRSTHPPLADRLDQLARLEQGLQRAH